MAPTKPLGHYAQLFGLTAAVAIRLRSIHTGTDDFVLEFFLPVDCVSSNDQQVMLNSLSITMQRVCRSLRTVTDKEFADEVEAASAEENGEAESVLAKPGDAIEERGSGDAVKPAVAAQGVQEKEAVVVEQAPAAALQLTESVEREDTGAGESNEGAEVSVESEKQVMPEVGGVRTFTSAGAPNGGNQNRRLDRRRGTAEKTIGLDAPPARTCAEIVSSL